VRAFGPESPVLVIGLRQVAPTFPPAYPCLLLHRARMDYPRLALV
jgi:hypothetical protein